jgi:hypothetical protein
MKLKPEQEIILSHLNHAVVISKKSNSEKPNSYGT